ncbi:putative ribosomal protein L28/L24 [Helianthus annuus]|uniref:Large ribosomal subunit protein bL28m n=1 Tax=Helianthus annuus TaxID=4232 RepID=A0A251TCV8_HELAN|nr:39S ribosomal protein L28, mitochondrial [Helianthus annuus]KAF5782820.1 putative ribosomal protein L28/L24 [Helianthus annuus]KAJ0502272.1 putative ribosomal protein L28/L24 [Helianthus annuus]KAJ0518195.1 putative ribosomal protein L28/L24 [Helianthus annuus]KAJ0686226.1 putative ribosomal protein L28/L24 [Helianthus annuus]KAJ0690055.1 putative ribosomal protein L28/L24 [Helianthus annuus]
MAFRSKEMVKKIMKKIGGEKNLNPGVKESLKKSLPESKVVMSRAHRGIYAGRHIQFGNQVSEKGGNKTRRNWKPNVQEKRLFSYILDRHIRVKVTTHALRCIDKAGGIDEYLLKTPYKKMDTEMGLLWKSKIEKMYQELGNMEVVFFPQEEENKLAEEFKDMRIEQRVARRDARRIAYGWSPKVAQIKEASEDGEANHHEELVANS